MGTQTKKVISIIAGFGLLSGLVWLFIVACRSIWSALVQTSPEVAVGVITAAATVLISTLTVMLGRYYERVRDIEAHFRADKIKMYDHFLQELFKTFHASGHGDDNKLVDFLREWQRKLVLWGGAEVLKTYVDWISNLKKGKHDATTIFLMDDFFRALRSDIGQKSRNLPRGFFSHFVLRHADLFLFHAEKNPSITLADLGRLEKELGVSAENLEIREVKDGSPKT